MLSDKSSEALIKILPKLKNPPSQLYLEYNVIKTHKYPSLELFTLKRFDQTTREKYINNQRKVRNTIFKHEFRVEKESMKDDRSNFETAKEEIIRMVNRKIAQLKEVETLKVIAEKRRVKELEDTKAVVEESKRVEAQVLAVMNRLHTLEDHLVYDKESGEKKAEQYVHFTKSIKQDMERIADDMKAITEQCQK